jgi:hypothetical protein
MSPVKRGFHALSLAMLFAAMAVAQANGPDITKRLDGLEKATRAAQMSGDNAWMLTSSALVLMMTAPGLALFYCGLVRRKNVLATMMHGFVLMGVVTILWAVVGYSLAFSEGTPFIGGLRYLFLNGVGADPNPDYAATIPHQTYMVYQLMFAIITPALICGAFAERMRFSAMLLFMTLWMFVVYFPMAHMVWGKGGLLNGSLGGRYPGWDFAGGTVVHIGSFGAGLRVLYGQADGISARIDAAAQSGAERDRRGHAVGRLVRLQRRQCLECRTVGDQRLRRHAFRRGGRGIVVAVRGMVGERKAKRAGRDFGRGRGTGGHYPRFGLCPADGSHPHRRGGGRGLLPDG